MRQQIDDTDSEAALQRLAADRKMRTSEQLEINDFYGNASILKRYCGLPLNSSLKAAIEHGIRFGETNWSSEVNAPFAVYFCWSPIRFPTIKSETNKACFALGPMITYVPEPPRERIDALKAAYGRNILFFPSHSTHWIDTEYDVAAICSMLQDVGRDFDTIRICMYWRDIQRGAHRLYKKHGFVVECAGHMFDRNFYPRLRTIIEPATVTASMSPGSCLGHCLALGKPHAYYTAETSQKSDHPKYFSLLEQSVAHCSQVQQIMTLFREFQEDITDEQLAFAKTHFGLGQQKSPTELRQVLELGEEIWALGQTSPTDQDRLLSRMLLLQALERQHLGDRLMALEYVREALAISPELERRALAILHHAGMVRAA